MPWTTWPRPTAPNLCCCRKATPTFNRSTKRTANGSRRRPEWQRDLGRGPVWSDYAATNVHEYLAEGVMMKYCAGSRRLREQDPGLHEHVRDLVG